VRYLSLSPFFARNKGEKPTRIEADLTSYNKFTQIASRAVRQGLNETERVAAEKRAEIAM
jgi:hypothetical protein